MSEATIRGTLRPQTIYGIPVPGSYSGGVTAHGDLTGRDADDQHPISAITGLQSALDGKGTYTKPGTGIPKTDLAAAVQTSLGKADTALQEQLLYKCDYGVTPYADIVAVINDGKIPYVVFANHFFIYGKTQDNEVSFTVAVGVYAYQIHVTASGWSYDGSVYATTDDLTQLSDKITGLFSRDNTIVRNYFNPDTITYGYKIDASGNIVEATDNFVSAPIYIPAGATNAVISYTGSNGVQTIPSTYTRIGAFYYGANGEKLGGKYGAHAIPDGAVYVRLTSNATYSTTTARRRIMYEFASDISGFYPYTNLTIYSGDTQKNRFNFAETIFNGAPKIKIIGDSIAQGVGGTGFAQDGELIFDAGGTNVWHVNTNGYCWANAFKSHIESISGATVKNWGCRGISCMDVWVFDMLPTLINDDDDIIMIMLGTNDRNDENVTANASKMYQMNLKAICNYVLSRGKKLILLSPIPATPSGDAASDVKFQSNAMNLVCTSIAEQIGCLYINVYKSLVDWVHTTNATYSDLYSDALHPNDKGYELVFYLICRELNIPLDLNFSFVK